MIRYSSNPQKDGFSILNLRAVILWQKKIQQKMNF